MRRSGFTLVEVVIALAVFAFALLSILALLPLGLKSNRVSSEEVRATCILTALEADLRNTHPLENSGKSKYFGLVLPYTIDASGHVTLNRTLSTNTLSADTSVGLDENEQPATAALRLQVTVLYTRVPPAGSHGPIEARFIVSWPWRNTTDPIALTAPGNTGGFVESYVTFPSP